MSPNESLPATMDADALLEALVNAEVSPVPAGEALAQRARIVSQIEAQRVAIEARARKNARRRMVATFAVAACLPFVVWAGASAVRVAGERHARAEGATIVTPHGSGAEVAHDGEARGLEDARNASLAANDELHTGPGATARASLPTGAVVEVSPSSRLRFEHAETAGARGDRIELLVGKIDVQVPKLGPGAQVSVHTTGATVVVHGTRFSVEHAASSAATHGAGETRIVVVEGRVSVTTKRGEDMLTGGTELVVPEPVEESVAAGEAATPPSVSDTVPAVAPVAQSAPSPSTTLAVENALFAEALRLRREGQGARALGVLDELLDRYPNSPLAESARTERRRALDDLRGPRP